ncbi:penicillin acylase family protein [Bacteroidota bacterium]
MKVFKIILKALVVLILLVLIGAAVLVRHISHRAIPDYNANVQIENLRAEVVVLRDTFGIPHIYAENEEDLYRVTGYVMAQDRFWQMDLFRHATQGRLSEIFGEDMLDADQLFRALRIEDKSRLIMEKSEPEIMTAINAYSEGINQYISDMEKKLPFEFAVLGYSPELWLPIHSINLIGYMSWSSSSSWRNEPALYKVSRLVDSIKLNELIPDIELQQAMFPDFMPNDEAEIETDLLSASNIIDELGLRAYMGSNNWALSGEHSFNGKPIVSNDMHLGLDMAPGIWYQMHQTIPGKLNVSGIVLPGTPFVNVGHNDSIAWGMTYVSLDDIDFYLETINPQDTNQYLLDGEWRDMEIREEIIQVKGGTEEKRINRFTHRGPVISSFKGIDDRVISMRWSGNEYSNEVKAAYLMDHADNINEFREALRSWTTISTNSICGDASGNIGLFVASGVPIRAGDGALVLPGDTSLYDWQGFVPFEQLPHGINPPEGILASANNRSAGKDYPYHISHWFAVPSRYNRIMELLTEKDVFTMDDMVRIQSDQKSKWVEKVMGVCSPVLYEGDLEGTSLAAYDRLHAWDGTMDRDEIQSSLFEVFYIKLTEAVFMDELGEDSYPELASKGTIVKGVMDRIMEGQELTWCDDVSTVDTTESFSDLVIPAWIAAVDWLEENYGEDMEGWVWGDLHQVSMTHALGSVNILKKIFRLEKGPYRVGGSVHTICPYGYPGLSPFVVNLGASQRHVYNLMDPDDSRIISPTGVSGIPASDFYCNQTEMYIRNEYMSESFSRDKVEANALFMSVFTSSPQ